MPGCGVLTGRKEPCGRPPVDAAGRCLFHSPEPKDPVAFREAFVKLATQADASEGLDFSDYVFPDVDLAGATFFRDVSFKRAVFQGAVSFEHVHFKGEAHFGHARFLGRASFSEATFKKDVVFSDADFAQSAWFVKTRFHGQGLFVRTRFQQIAGFTEVQFLSAKAVARLQCVVEGEANFIEARFGGACELSHSSFRGLAAFGRATFVGPAKLDLVEFRGDALLNRAEFHAAARFDDTTFAGLAAFRDVAFREGASFSRASFERDGVFEDLAGAGDGTPVAVDFSRVRLGRKDGVRFVGTAAGEGRLDLSRVRFVFTDVGMLRFVNVGWGEDGRRAGPLRRFLDSDLVAAVRVADEDDLPGRGAAPTLEFAHVADVYKGLRDSYERTLRYDEAGRFHVREMEMRRLAAKAPARDGRGRGRDRRNRLMLEAYKSVSLYGESYRRAGVWTVGVILAFALLRWGLLVAWGMGSGDPLLDSLRAFFQARSEDAVDVAERVAGLVLLALFGLAVRRNFKR